MEDDSIPTQLASPPLQIRGYQLEMFNESLKSNVLVVMDTGSGKTLVAILRIQHELEHTTSSKVSLILSKGCFAN